MPTAAPCAADRENWYANNDEGPRTSNNHLRAATKVSEFLTQSMACWLRPLGFFRFFHLTCWADLKPSTAHRQWARQPLPCRLPVEWPTTPIRRIRRQTIQIRACPFVVSD